MTGYTGSHEGGHHSQLPHLGQGGQDRKGPALTVAQAGSGSGQALTPADPALQMLLLVASAPICLPLVPCCFYTWSPLYNMGSGGQSCSPSWVTLGVLWGPSRPAHPSNVISGRDPGMCLGFTMSA